MQDKWDTICNICIEAGETVLGKVEKHKKEKDKKVQELSEEVHKISNEISATQDKENRRKKEKKRRELKGKVRARLKEIEERKLDKKLQDIENSRNDSNRYYKIIKEIRRMKKIEPLTVLNEEGEFATQKSSR